VLLAKCASCLGVDNRLRREACRYADIPEVFSRKLAPDTIVKRMREVYNIPSRPDEQQDPRDTPPKQDRGGVKRPAPDREMTRSSPHEAPPQEQSTKTPAQNGTAVGRIQVKVVDQEGGEVTFKLKRSTPMQRLMDLYCAQVGLEASHVRFLLDEGTSIAPESTADSLGLVDGTCIECIEDRWLCGLDCHHHIQHSRHGVRQAAGDGALRAAEGPQHCNHS